MTERLSPSNKPVTRWCLESTIDGGKNLHRVRIQRLPFRIGRLDNLELTLPFHSVSKEHAEIYLEGSSLKVRDLKSTNGTFVNREKVDGASLREGDILHFAEVEFRVGLQPDLSGETFTGDPERGTLALRRVTLPEQFVGGTRELSELIERGLADAMFQPIVTLPEGRVTAYEVLGRGTHEGLPESPSELFRIAETVGLERELSRLFRERALARVAELDRELPLLFLNTHPAELEDRELVSSLIALRDIAPRAKLALELHERAALAETGAILELKQHLEKLDIRIAYDDFGAGERLFELAEVPPDYLKFDMRYVQGIDEAPASRRRLLSALVAAALELEAQPIAEGIERVEEAEICSSVGFPYAQGYFYARPLPLIDL